MRRLAILLSVASIAGCTQRIGQLTLMSTKNLAATPKVVQQQVTGEDCVNQILGIPAERLVRTAISLGYPDEEARRSRPKRAQARKPLSDIVHEERYS